IGLLSNYRKPFWRAARHALRRGQIDAVLGMGFIAHHLIQFTREALRGEQNASYYSTKSRAAEPFHSPELAALRKPAQARPAPRTMFPWPRAEEPHLKRVYARLRRAMVRRLEA